MRVTSLASGSSGNAYLVEAGSTRILLDAGRPAPELSHFLIERGIRPTTLAAIFVSHEHSDHVRGVGVLARRHRVPVVANEGTFRAAAEALGALPERTILRTGGECRVGALLVRTFPVSHDARDPVGFWVEAEGQHVCICTDLGRPTPAIQEPLAAADLLVVEANHDTGRLWGGPYPPTLKRRIAGPEGHLANTTTADLLLGLARAGRQPAVWLAHLSATNNTPTLARTTVTARLALEGIRPHGIAVALRDRPSLVWDSAAPPAEEEDDDPALAYGPIQLDLPF